MNKPVTRQATAPPAIATTERQNFGQMLRELKQPQASLQATAAPTETTGQRVPSTKRVRTFQRNVEKARKAITAELIRPTAREVAVHCQCANRTALSILTELTKRDVLKRDGRGWSVA